MNKDKQKLMLNIAKIEKKIKQKKEDIALFSDKNQYHIATMANMLFFLRIELKMLENKLAKLNKQLAELTKNEVEKEKEE